MSLCFDLFRYKSFFLFGVCIFNQHSLTKVFTNLKVFCISSHLTDTDFLGNKQGIFGYLFLNFKHIDTAIFLLNVAQPSSD